MGGQDVLRLGKSGPFHVPPNQQHPARPLPTTAGPRTGRELDNRTATAGPVPRVRATVEEPWGNALPIPPPGFDDLDIDAQIEYVQALWDRIAAKEDVVPVPDWHRALVEERLADLEANPETSRPWEEVKANLLNQTRGDS